MTFYPYLIFFCSSTNTKFNFFFLSRVLRFSQAWISPVFKFSNNFFVNKFNFKTFNQKGILLRTLSLKIYQMIKFLSFFNSSWFFFCYFFSMPLNELLTWNFFSPLLMRNNRCTIRFKIIRTVSYRISVDLFWERFPDIIPISNYSSPLLKLFCAWLVHMW